jgi:hypothetical protein
MSDCEYTEGITKDFMRALRHRDSLKEQLEKAEGVLREVGNKLGARIAPDDMHDTEIISVWHRVDNYEERCYTVSKNDDGYTVYLRGSPRPMEVKQ